MKLNNRKLRDQLVSVKMEGVPIPATGTSTNEILYNFVVEIALAN